MERKEILHAKLGYLVEILPSKSVVEGFMEEARQWDRR